MDIVELARRADEIKRQYADLNAASGHQQWGLAEYAQGFVGDVGDLLKLVMAKNQFRAAIDVDDRIRHELVDCLWSVLVIAGELGIDLGAAFNQDMDALETRITARMKEVANREA